MWGFSGSGGGWYYGLHLLFSWLMPLAIVALLVYLAAGWSKEKKSDVTDPLVILKQRYAKGEITSEEYHRMKEELQRD